MFFIPFIIRLQKAIKDEIENGTGPPASTDTDAGVKIKKDVEEIQTKKPVLSLEVQKKINTLMKRYTYSNSHFYRFCWAAEAVKPARFANSNTHSFSYLQ